MSIFPSIFGKGTCNRNPEIIISKVRKLFEKDCCFIVNFNIFNYYGSYFILANLPSFYREPMKHQLGYPKKNKDYLGFLIQVN